MKQIFVMIAVLGMVGCGKKEEEKPETAVRTPLTPQQSTGAIEAVVREVAGKSTGELSEADIKSVRRLDFFDYQLTNVKGLEKFTHLTELDLYGNQLTDLKGLEKLTQLKWLHLGGNPGLTETQIAEIQKALPNCNIAR